MKKLFIMLLIAILIAGVSSTSLFAAPRKIEDVKMKRGVKNVALGWTEIPDSIVKVTKDTNNPFLGITIGLFEGILNAFARTASGAVDVATFPLNSDSETPTISTEVVK